MLCSYCASYSLRKQALYGDMSRYICCNGNWPCSGRCGEQSSPECCLCMEVFFCFAQSVASTRWMIQDELRIQTTECDNCIIGTMVAMQYFACICSIVACLTGSDEVNDLAQLLDCVADFLWCTVCACMQTQHKEELGIRDKGGPGAAGRAAPTHAPAVQMIQTGQGYPPQPGYPVQGGYPPQAGSYPPQAGYPQTPGYPPPAGYPQQQMYR
eukprot:GHRR01013855.1.p1 GENE.GHRR01013855.1~~GHRR01013855.1.p1  ORF type:complete len:212 (+),score=45.40 GHRR01013855.1:436-1071(+)